MAASGQRPKVQQFKALEVGGKGRAKAMPEIEVRTDPLKPPQDFRSDTERMLWERYIDPAWWIAESDTSKAYLWVYLNGKFLDDPDKFPTTQLGHLRMLGSELGFDPLARSRMSIGSDQSSDRKDNYFDTAAA